MNATLPTILIVDDETANRHLLADLLKDECRILMAKDGASALQRVREENISLVLLDASMPEMDGYEVLRRLKADEKTADLSVIFVTGQTDEEDEERGLLLGAVDYIAKPIRPLLVKARVRNHLKFARQRELLEQLSMQDGLTGIANRRCFDQALERAWLHSKRSGDTLALAMIDVDHFKAYNDQYGHAAGDEALKQVAFVLSSAMKRPYDLAARYGGEEFVLLLPGIDQVHAVLEQLRTAIMALDIAHSQSTAADVLTISCGALVKSASDGVALAELLQRADAALYEAKHQGRNRVVIGQL